MSEHLKFLHMTRKFSTDNVRGVRDKYQVWIFLCLLISALLWLQNCINLSGSLPLGVVMIVFKVPQLQSRADQPYGSAVKEAACRFFGACAFLDGIAHIRALIPAKVFQ